MQVKLVTSGIGNGNTGLSRYASTLHRELLKSGEDVELTRPRIPFDHALASLGQLLHLDPITFLSNYPVAIDSERADVYHLTSENLASLLMFRRLRPVVVTVHAFFTYFLRDDPDFAMHDHKFHRSFDSLAARGLHRADAIIAVSDYVADLLINDLGIPPRRVHVVYEAVDQDFFRPLEVPATFWEKYELDPQYFYFLYVGSEQRRKNFPALVKAFARVRAENEQVRLLKIGVPELQSERDQVVKLIRDLGITNDVTFIGHIGDDLPLFYNASDVFVFPSFYEGFGFPPLEAMACGTPVICSSTTSLPEVVGEAALMFSPLEENALVTLMKDLLLNKALRNQYRELGLQQTRRFSWKTTTQLTIDTYRRLIQRA